MIMVSVRCADFTTGSRKARTPLLTASTPVIAVQPLENACSSSHAVRTPVCAGSGGGAATATGRPPDASVLPNPSAIAPRRLAINR